MRLVGDPDGIATLKELVAASRDYLKFLIGEAQSNTNHTTTFRKPDGPRWNLRLVAETAELEVTRGDA